MKIRIALIAFCCAAILPAVAGAEVCNLKIVTDASPDFTDMQSMINSVTSKWETTPEKLYAMYWWNHINRRQCAPMYMHGYELTDPIMQFNDYGFTMCSTISGINCGIWANMGLNVHFWDIASHTVPEVEYDGSWHLYDDSMSVICTTCDGKRIAGVEEIAAEGACALSGGKKEKFHVGIYHNLFCTQPGPLGCLTGAESSGRPNVAWASCFRVAKTPVWFMNYWDWGHHYSLNVRPNEVYTRYYQKQDGEYPFGHSDQVKFTHDPRYYTIEQIAKDANPMEEDPEFSAKEYHIRGNGVWEYQPTLTASDAKDYYSMSDVAFEQPAGIRPAKAGQAAEVIFRVHGANVITSQEIMADFVRKTADDTAKISISTDNGMHWKEVFAASATGDVPAKISLLKEVNTTYEVLIKVEMLAKGNAQDVALKSLHVKTITQINSKTQPRLNIGKNVIYIGAGDQTETTVIWPQLHADAYKAQVVDSKNITSDPNNGGYSQLIWPTNMEEEAYLTYKLAAPRDITSIVIGGRYKHVEDSDKGTIAFLYSLDEGKTWKEAWKTGGTPCPRSKGHYGSPTDAIHYETVAIPAGNKSVLVKYSLDRFGLYALRTEANYLPGDATFKPLEVTFTWNERQEDYSMVKRSHTQLVEKLPFKYEINVGGADHPQMVSLSVNQKGSASGAATQPVKYGYSDGVDNASAKKYVGTWTLWGKDIAVGKPYTIDKPGESMKGFDAKTGLTDGQFAAPCGWGWDTPGMAFHREKPTFDLDLGEAKDCAALGISLHGREGFTGLLSKDMKIEVLVSNDNKTFKSVGFINLKPRYKDIPYNYMLADNESMGGGRFYVIPDKPVNARYVRYKFVTQEDNWLVVDELVVMDSVKTTPFDIKIALPDEVKQAKKK